MSRLPRLSLQLVLVVPFALQTCAAVALVGWLSWRNGERAVNKLAGQLSAEVSDRIAGQLDAYLAVPVQVNQFNAIALETGGLDLNAPVALERHFWRQLRVYQDLQYIYIGTEDRGGFIGAGRTADHQLTIEATRNYTAGNFEVYATDNQGRRQERLSSDPGYDPRQRPWYAHAAARGEPIWSEIYSIFPQAMLGISAAQPIYDEQNQLQGVLAADFVLQGIGNFLEQLDTVPTTAMLTGTIVLLERSGLMVATSTGESPLQDGNDAPQRILARDSRDPLVQETMRQVAAQVGELGAIAAPVLLTYPYGGEQYRATVTPLALISELDWLAVVILPERTFMAEIEASRRLTIALCLAALAISLVLGSATARWLAKPLQQLSRTAPRLAQGHFEDRLPENLSVQELAALAQAFNQMAAKLQTLFADLAETNHVLEARVSQRTAELRDRAQELESTLQDLKQAQMQLIQTEKMSSLGQLAAGLAHEINNPVSFIYGNLNHARDNLMELLKLATLYQEHDPDPPPAIANHLDQIDLDFIERDLPALLDSMQAGADRIRILVLSLRSFVRLDEVDFKTIDLRESLTTTLVLLQHRLAATAQRPAIAVCEAYRENLPPVICQPGPMNQVLINLLTNAIDALDEAAQKGTLREEPTLRLQLQAEAGEMLLTIADNGGGMSAATQAKIFEPFFTTKPVGQGTGMGLAIAYQIVVQQHGGRLHCDSVPGQGTTFTLALPLKR